MQNDEIDVLLTSSSRRPDGYRPYDEAAFKEAFKNKEYYYRDDPFENLRARYGSRAPPPEFRSFNEFRQWQMNNQRIDPAEMRLVKFAVYLFISMAIYIVVVRIMVVRNHMKGNRRPREEWEQSVYGDDMRSRDQGVYGVFPGKGGRFPPPF